MSSLSVGSQGMAYQHFVPPARKSITSIKPDTLQRQRDRMSITSKIQRAVLFAIVRGVSKEKELFRSFFAGNMNVREIDQKMVDYLKNAIPPDVLKKYGGGADEQVRKMLILVRSKIY